MEFNFSELIPVQGPKYAMVKTNFEMEFMSENDISGSISFECGEIVQYSENDDDIHVYHGPATLHFQDDEFLQCFQAIDQSKVLHGWRYQTLEEFAMDARTGETYRIHDFEKNEIIQVVLTNDRDSGELTAKLLIAARPQDDKSNGMMIACNNISYIIEDYGNKWAALIEE